MFSYSFPLLLKISMGNSSLLLLIRGITFNLSAIGSMNIPYSVSGWDNGN